MLPASSPGIKRNLNGDVHALDYFVGAVKMSGRHRVAFCEVMSVHGVFNYQKPTIERTLVTCPEFFQFQCASGCSCIHALTYSSVIPPSKSITLTTLHQPICKSVCTEKPNATEPVEVRNGKLYTHRDLRGSDDKIYGAQWSNEEAPGGQFSPVFSWPCSWN